MTNSSIYLLDYGAGNVRSLVNAVNELGYQIKTISSPKDFEKADKIIFPGVGSFGGAMTRLTELGYIEPLKAYINSNKPFMGICVGLQVLFENSQESKGIPGLGIIPGKIIKFSSKNKSVPHMGWNSASLMKSIVDQAFISSIDKYYFVHSFACILNDLKNELTPWIYSLTTYKDETFISSIRKGNIFATQFHPEKSGKAGLKLLKSFLESKSCLDYNFIEPLICTEFPQDQLTQRIIACLDVRNNDDGDLVVTKGDKYDVRDKGSVRNLGKPVELAKRYYQEGADEITFLNITSFRNCPLKDTPMLKILEKTSESVFVPLTIGGGIRDIIEPDGTKIPAIAVAGEYFRSGADKVSIGSDAVYAAENYYLRNQEALGDSGIEIISKIYGSQAVVISVDPRKVYVSSPSEAPNHFVIKTDFPGPGGEQYCWYQCTVKGGREGRNIDVVQLVKACECLGAGEILLNSMDKDGTNSGYDLELLKIVKNVVKIPVIASSGAGTPSHFSQVFKETGVEAALAAGIFHRQEVPISKVKDHLISDGFEIRKDP